MTVCFRPHVLKHAGDQRTLLSLGLGAQLLAPVGTARVEPGPGSLPHLTLGLPALMGLVFPVVKLPSPLQVTVLLILSVQGLGGLLGPPALSRALEQGPLEVKVPCFCPFSADLWLKLCAQKQGGRTEDQQSANRAAPGTGPPAPSTLPAQISPRAELVFLCSSQVSVYGLDPGQTRWEPQDTGLQAKSNPTGP